MTTATGQRRITPTGLLLTAAVEGDDWHAARARGIGSSDAAAILGLSPWKDRLGLWLEKTGQVVDDRESTVMTWGKRLEDGIASGFAEDHGVQVAPAPGVLQHEEHSFVLASPDRLIVEDGLPVSILECKNVSGWKAEEWDMDAGIVPQHYYVQVQHQLLTTGFEQAHIAALCGGNELRSLVITADLPLQALLLEQEAEFWRLVQDMERPAMADPLLAVEVLQRVKRAPGKTVEAFDAAAAWDLRARLDAVADEKAALARQVKEVEEREKALRAQVLDQLGDGEVLTAGGVPLFTYKTQSKKPQAASTFRVFRRPKVDQPADL